MKRVATVIGNDGVIRTKITIEVNTKRHDLTHAEVKHVVDCLTGDIFAAVQKTPYSHYPVTQIKVN